MEQVKADNQQAGGTVIDLAHVLRLRVIVARVGEMDLARWWNTEGQLGSLGSTVLKRGFPRTHRFAQARSVFAVAAHRCAEVYEPPGTVTLWRLPPDVEDEFDLVWEQWLDDAPAWEPFFTEVESCGSDLQTELIQFGLVDDAQVEVASRLRRSAENRAVTIPGVFEPTTEAVTLLALAFSRGEPGQLAVPVQPWSLGT
jgi:hypothetical protein